MLPALIEYLSSQEEAGGVGRLCHPALTSFGVFMAPNSVEQFRIAPGPSYFASISYGIGVACLPERIEMYWSQAGERYLEGLVTGEEMYETIGNYLIFTSAQPIQLMLVNLTALNQGIDIDMWLLMIDTEEKLKIVKQHILAYSATQTNALIREQIRLLGKIAGVK